MRYVLMAVAVLCSGQFAYVQIAKADDSEICGQGTVSEAEQLKACSRVISSYRNSGSGSATAAIQYNNVQIARMSRAEIYEKQGKFELAARDLDALIKLGQADNLVPVLYRLQASFLVRRLDFDRAIENLTEPIRRRAKFSNQLYAIRAGVWAEKGDYDRALEDYAQAIRLDPNEQWQNDRAVVWERKGDQDRALAEYSEGIRVNPASSMLLNGRALIWRDRGEFDRALADYDQALRLAPGSELYLANRGEIWRLKGDLDKALADQNEALRPDATKGNTALTRVLRGDTLRYRGEFAAALLDYDEALRTSQDMAIPARVGRGLTLERMGNASEARNEFEKAVSIAGTRRLADIQKSSFETALSRLAALRQGAVAPTIAPAPIRVSSATSIPTPAIGIVSIAQPQPGRDAISKELPITGPRVALVIGNSAYQRVPELANPKNDATAMAGLLRNIGFETVTLALDLSKDRLIEALRSFAGEADKADWAMVYYAGHGVEVNGQNYLIPVDAALKTDRDVQFETVPLDHVTVTIDGARKLKLIVLDACRDNPFAPTMEKTGVRDVVAARSTAGGAVGTRSSGRGLGEVKVAGASLVVFAAKHGQTALDGEGSNSPFAVAMAQRIATPGVEINKVFRLVRDDVMEATAGRQEPYTYGSLPGKEDFFFIAGK